MKLGDRMKDNYENRQRYMLTRRMPVIIRVDGRAFHSLRLGKPFDKSFISAMITAAANTAYEIQGFKLAYVQSDEVSFLLTDYDTLETEAHFGYVKSKLESITAATMTVYFNRLPYTDRTKNFAPVVFDARSFNIPREEVTNYFLWRAKDWERNSLSMYCSHFFSHRELHGKNKVERHEMLHSIGKNWATDLDDQLKNGTFILQNGGLVVDIPASYESIDLLVRPHMGEKTEIVIHPGGYVEMHE